MMHLVGPLYLLVGPVLCGCMPSAHSGRRFIYDNSSVFQRGPGRRSFKVITVQQDMPQV